MRVLLVEDEPKISAYVRRGLEEAGYAADEPRPGVREWFLLQAFAFTIASLNLFFINCAHLERGWWF